MDGTNINDTYTQKHKLEKFKDKEIIEKIEHSMEQCPCCKSHEIETTGERKEKDELDYKIVVVKNVINL